MSEISLYSTINDDNIIDAISKDDILKYISEEQLFELIINEIPKLDKKYTSPFRNDINPNCYFDYFCGQLRFIDWANSEVYKGIKMSNVNCFEAIQYYFKLNDLQSTLNYIFDNFINNSNKVIENHIIKNHKYIDKPLTKIEVEYRKFQKRDLYYWSKFGISLDNLIQDNVLPVNRYALIKDDVQIYRTKNICYSLGLFQNDKHKLYFPLNKEYRFITNCTQNDVGMINQIDKSLDYIVISKSYKDYRVLKNFNINTIWFQNEVTIPSDSILQYISSIYKTIYIFFDNDQTGLINTKKLNNHLSTLGSNIISMFIEPTYKEKYSVKDISDMYWKLGKEKVTDFLIQNNLIL